MGICFLWKLPTRKVQRSAQSGRSVVPNSPTCGHGSVWRMDSILSSGGKTSLQPGALLGGTFVPAAVRALIHTLMCGYWRFLCRRWFTGPWTRGTQRCRRRLARVDRGGMVPGGEATQTTAVHVRGLWSRPGPREGKGGEGGLPDISQSS